MNKGLYSFLKDDELFVVICKNENPSEWEKLRKLDGWEIESGDHFFIIGTDARAELEEVSSGKSLTFKSNEVVFFRLLISNEIVSYLETKEELGFYLIQSEVLVGEEQVYKMFLEKEIEGLVCAFYTENEKKKIFELDGEGNILSLK